MMVDAAVTHIYAFIRETGWDGGALFFGFREKDREFLDSGHRYVSSVIPGKQCLRSQLIVSPQTLEVDRNAPCP
jgi:hypothetical protein